MTYQHFATALCVVGLVAFGEQAMAHNPTRIVLCNWQNEKDCLDRLKGKAFRSETVQPQSTPESRASASTLTLVTAKGHVALNNVVVPTDQPQDKAISYFLTGWTNGYFIVEAIMFQEHGTAMLISDQTGQKIDLPNTPVFSPSARRFFVTANFAFGGPDEPYLQIFAFGAGGPKRIFNLKNYPVEGLAWESIDWAGEDAIAFKPAQGASTPSPLQIGLKKGRWQITSPN